MTKIEWTDESWNPVRARLLADTSVVGWHCEHASEGCRNCYAEARNVSGRCNLGTMLAYKPGHRKEIEIFLDEKALAKPLHWRKPRGIFPGSMTDLFAGFVTDDMLDRIFAVAALTPQHTYQFLTKRPPRMREWFARYDAAHDHNCADFVADAVATLLGREAATGDERTAGHEFDWPLPNVWLGVSVENQAAADARIPDLLATPAAVRWLSCEPLLGPVQIPEYLPNPLWNDLPSWQQPELDWVVCGGESGPKARPMHPDWARDLRDQCAAAGVPFFFKQWGEWLPGEIFHPESEKGANLVHWLDGSEEWNGEHIDFDSEILSHHTPDGCPVAANEAEQVKAKGWIDGNAAGKCATNCSREACRKAARWCMGDNLPWLTIARSVGKKRSGRMLDGALHDAMPQVPA